MGSTVPGEARQELDSLLDAVNDRPLEFPLREVTALSQAGLSVEMDRRGSAPVVFLAPDRDEVFDLLSKREREVVTLLAAGFSNEQIATTLFVSVPTVKGHIQSVFVKTGLRSRTQVVAAWYGGIHPSADGTSAIGR